MLGDMYRQLLLLIFLQNIIKSCSLIFDNIIGGSTVLRIRNEASSCSPSTENIVSYKILLKIVLKISNLNCFLCIIN